MHLLCLGGAKGGATVGLYQNGGYDESLQMRLARSPQRSLHRPDLFPHTPAYDLFPYTADIHGIVSTHVECVIALSKGEIDSKKVRVEFSLEGMDTSGLQKGATYPEIKARVLEQTGLKVSSLYISQIKQKCGLEVRENHHKAKSENTKQPHCPKEKEDAIVEALKHFQMI